MPARLTLTASATRVDVTRRTIAGTVVRYGETGHTSAGPLSVAAGALTWPVDVTAVPLTLEHDRTAVRGSVALVDDTPERLYVAIRVADGPEGDAALAEAADRTDAGRGGLSFDLDGATITDGVITAGTVGAIGQVKDPAFNSARIDRIAAAAPPPTPTGESIMTPEQIARLAELRALTALTQDQATELAGLVALEAPADPAPAAPAAVAAPQPVAASMPVVPAGVPLPGAGRLQIAPVSPLTQFVDQIAAAWRGNKMHGDGAIRDAVNQVVTAALADVTQTGAGAVERKQWIGELWDGLDYSPMFLPLLSSDGMDNFSGIGWHWATKPVAVDYAGDKAAITTAAISVAADSWTAARVVVGHDIDRKFFDFPGEDNAAFIRSYLQASAEAVIKLLDTKALAYITNVANVTATVGAAGLGVLKAAATGKIALTNQWMGSADWVLVNDADYLALMDTTASNVPAFLETIGLTPDKFIPTASVATKSVYTGVRNAATFRTPKGQPFRVEVQNVPNGGIDLVSFAYWATEKHTALGIQKVSWT